MDFVALGAGPDGLFEEVDFEGEKLDVEGLLLGSDGSASENTKDVRVRRCGFGVAVLRVHIIGRFEAVSLAFCSVPGAQESYRAEATAILFALLTPVETAAWCGQRKRF